MRVLYLGFKGRQQRAANFYKKEQLKLGIKIFTDRSGTTKNKLEPLRIHRARLKKLSAPWPASGKTTYQYFVFLASGA